MLDAGRDAGIDAGRPDAGVIDAGPTPCIPGVVTLSRAQPTTLFVIDRSGSMGFAFGTSTRWRELRRGLSAALPPVDETMALGAYIFPSRDVGLECAAPSTVDLLPALGNADAINDLMLVAGPLGGTPTADALNVASRTLRQVRAAKTARALILATDGAPGCNMNLNAFTCTCTRNPGCGTSGPGDCLDDARTVDRMAAITDAGLPTWVIGISDGNDMLLTDVLNRMAIAGGRPRSGFPRYYPASNSAELSAALVNIRDQIGQCTFLTASVPDAQGNIRVLIDGQEQGQDGPNGWRWADRSNGELELLGFACSNLRPNANVTATVGCSPQP